MLTIEIKVTDSEGKCIFQDTAKVDDNRSETEKDFIIYLADYLNTKGFIVVSMDQWKK